MVENVSELQPRHNLHSARTIHARTKHARTKHMDIRHDFIRESVVNEKLSLGYVPIMKTSQTYLQKHFQRQKFCHQTTCTSYPIDKAPFPALFCVTQVPENPVLYSWHDYKLRLTYRQVWRQEVVSSSY